MKLLILLFGLALAAAPPAFAAQNPDEKKLQILTTTTDLRAIAAEVGGDRVEAKSLMKGPEDPHFLDAKPNFITLANRADLFIKIGMSLEAGYESIIIGESRNKKIQTGAPGYLDASITIEKLEIPTGPVDRSHGDVHQDGNPHYLLDPLNAKKVAGAIRDSLVKTSPQYKSELEDRCKQFCRKMDESMFGKKILERFSADTLGELLANGKLAAFVKDRKAEADLGGWAAEMLPFSGKPVAVYHKNLTYFAHRFHLEEAVTLEQKPGVRPSSSYLINVIETIKNQKIKAVFYTSFQSVKAVEKVCEETGAAKVLYPHQVGAIDDTGDYIKMIDRLVKLSSAALART
ncbi:MAG: metal ABC transporter substrate-binding protein [Planctomycetota bacterium]